MKKKTQIADPIDPTPFNTSAPTRSNELENDGRFFLVTGDDGGVLVLLASTGDGGGDKGATMAGIDRDVLGDDVARA
jgi:hypothetical protein